MAKNDITVNITKAQSIGSAGFGIPLVIQGMSDIAKEYAEYSDFTQVAEAGFSNSSAIYKQCEKIFMQENKPKKIAICAATSKITVALQQLQDKDYRQVIPCFGQNDDTIQELANYIEATEDKMLFVRVSSLEEVNNLGKLERTVAIVYSDENSAVEGAIIGATAGLEAGSFTYKNIILKGIIPEKFADTQLDNIHAAGAISVVKKAGDIVTSEGLVLSGEYIDVVDSRDWIIRNITYNAQKILNKNPKISFTNVGISQLENAVTNVLSQAFKAGMIAEDENKAPLYVTDFATREETPIEDRNNRKYNGGKFRFELAGAIHEAKINGTLEI